MLTKTHNVKTSEIATMVSLMLLEYPDFENQEMSVMALQLSKEFNLSCNVSDLEQYYSDISAPDQFEDFELESRKIENDFHSKAQEYEDTNRFS
tara:strand:+ start:590 stop:871 length:282 start_codon:yes stop_codon:yes gene_type:complete